MKLCDEWRSIPWIGGILLNETVVHCPLEWVVSQIVSSVCRLLQYLLCSHFKDFWSFWACIYYNEKHCMLKWSSKIDMLTMLGLRRKIPWTNWYCWRCILYSSTSLANFTDLRDCFIYLGPPYLRPSHCLHSYNSNVSWMEFSLHFFTYDVGYNHTIPPCKTYFVNVELILTMIVLFQLVRVVTFLR